MRVSWSKTALDGATDINLWHKFLFSIHNKIIFVMKRNKKSGVMTEEKNIKHETGNQEPKHESVNVMAKNIAAKAKPADSFEFDDKDEAQKVFDKLPEGEFILNEGDKVVIQKL